MFTKGEWMVEVNEQDGKMYVATEFENIVEVLFDDKHTMKANAHLIAAAPEMYKALKALIDHFRANDESYYASDLCTDAISALSKAERRQRWYAK